MTVIDTRTTIANGDDTSTRASSNKAMRVKRCAECEAVFDGSDWHPVALVDGGEEEADLVEFCSKACKRSYLAETV